MRCTVISYMIDGQKHLLCFTATSALLTIMSKDGLAIMLALFPHILIDVLFAPPLAVSFPLFRISLAPFVLAQFYGIPITLPPSLLPFPLCFRISLPSLTLVIATTRSAVSLQSSCRWIGRELLVRSFLLASRTNFHQPTAWLLIILTSMYTLATYDGQDFPAIHAVFRGEFRPQAPVSSRDACRLHTCPAERCRSSRRCPTCPWR